MWSGSKNQFIQRLNQEYSFDSEVGCRYHAPPMSRRLPEFVDPVKLCDTRQTLAGAVPLASMERLGQSLVQGIDQEAEVLLEFGSDEAGIRYVRGSVQAKLELVCQRCMGKMSWSVESQVALGIVRGARDLQFLPDHYEPLEMGDEPLSLTALVEDELILGLPIVAMHEPEICGAKNVIDSLNEQVDKELSKEKPESPFAVLKQLKSKQ